MRQDFEKFAIGTKVQSYDNYGYYIMRGCGVIVKHLGGGHAIIRGFDGVYYSTVSITNVAEVEAV